MALCFESVDISSVDQAELDQFPDRMVHQSLPWLQFIADAQNARPVLARLRNDRETLGYFSGLLVKKFGFTILGSPFPGWSTTYMGFNLKPGVPRSSAIGALTHFAFSQLRCHHLELMDRFATEEDYEPFDFHIWMFQGYEIDLRLEEDRLLADMSATCRNSIRKATRLGVRIEESTVPDFVCDYWAQLKHVFAVKGAIPLFGPSRVEQLIERLLPTGNLLLLKAMNEEGECVATGLFPALNKTAFFWGGASWRHHSKLGANEALVWYAMKYWKRRGIQTFDMVGLGDYKRKFGAYPIAIPWASKSRNRSIAFLRRSAESTFRRSHRVAGRVVRFVESIRRGGEKNG
ncbi:MAG: GNAT family N-acetyltransferase [Deltaproteobacteria bacterium]|nr:GNAT family N-acetyltransferase [Deltaproteobacteria bacterium]